MLLLVRALGRYEISGGEWLGSEHNQPHPLIEIGSTDVSELFGGGGGVTALLVFASLFALE